MKSSTKAGVPAVSGGGLLSKAVDFVVRNLSLTDAAGWGHSGAGGHTSNAGPSVNLDNVLGLSAAWACVNLTAGVMATVPIKLYKPDRAGGRVSADGHAVYRLVHDSPNADQSAVEFWEFMHAAVELKGNAFARKVRNAAGDIVALEPLPPDPSDVRRLADGSIRYRWSTRIPGVESGDGLADADVFHLRGFGGSPLGGLSTLRYGHEAFGTALAVERAASATFANGLRPSGVMKFANWLKPDQREVAKLALEREYMGCMAAGRPLILEGGQEWVQLTINPDDAQMLESRRYSVEDICRFFSVPPHLIGHTAGNTSLGSSIEEQTLAWVKFSLMRRFVRVQQAIAKQLLSPADRAAGLIAEFNMEGLLRGDSTRRAAFYNSGLGSGWLTVNEVRARENLPPVPGGDIPRVQMQNVPLDGAGNPVVGAGGDAAQRVSG